MDPMTMMAVAKAGGAVFSAIQSARGKKKMAEADKMVPPVSDPTALTALEDAKRRTKQIASGTDITTERAVEEAEESTRATQRDLGRVTGGNVPGTVSAMLQAQKMGGDVTNKAFAQAGQRADAANALVEQIRSQIEQRKLDIQQYKSVERRADGAQLGKEGRMGLMAGLYNMDADDVGKISEFVKGFRQAGGPDNIDTSGTVTNSDMASVASSFAPSGGNINVTTDDGYGLGPDALASGSTIPGTATGTGSLWGSITETN